MTDLGFAELWPIAMGHPVPTAEREPGLYMAYDPDRAEWESLVFRYAGHGHWRDGGGNYVPTENIARYHLVPLVPANEADIRS